MKKYSTKILIGEFRTCRHLGDAGQSHLG